MIYESIPLVMFTCVYRIIIGIVVSPLFLFTIEERVDFINDLLVEVGSSNIKRSHLEEVLWIVKFLNLTDHYVYIRVPRNVFRA